MSKKRRKAKNRRKPIQAKAPLSERRFFYPFMLGAVMLVAFLLRVIPQLGIVFRDGTVLFKEVDPWYHMRLVDAMVHQFPAFMIHDTYALFPDGAAVGFQPLLAWIVVGLGYVFSLGQPSQHMVEAIAAWLPPIFGILICVPVYLIGREMVGRMVGIIAALLVAILPTQLLFRSLLGFTDHHVLETLLSVTVVLFLLLALKRDRLRYAAFAGVALGLYLLNWHGAAFLVFILWLWVIVQSVLDWRAGRNLLRLCLISSLMFVVGFIIFLPYIPNVDHIKLKLLMFVVVIATPWAFYVFSRFVGSWRRGVAIMATMAGLGLLGIYVVDYGLLHLIGVLFKMIFWGFGTTIAEARPSNLESLMSEYGWCFFLGLGGLILAIWRREHPLILIWSILLFVALIGQRRWGYYFVINVSLMTAYLTWFVASVVKRELRPAALGFILMLFVLAPVISEIGKTITAPNHLTNGWRNAMVWVSENTPEPLPDGSYFSNDVEQKPEYSVLTWWDYGHWITRIGQRVPLASPALQTADNIGAFFVAQNPGDAEDAIDGLGVRYVVIDGQIMTGKFYALVNYANYYRSRNGLDGYSKGNLRQLRDGSNMAMIYLGNEPNYQLVFESEDVRIFERRGYDVSEEAR